ncbi:peptidase S08 family protein [Oscillibacter valericigenes Sjm18-20]|nr:peptidase S08 family protein [Oscillibacter valericigenes Sjm18-20]
MNGTESVEQIIYSPDTVDFVVRQNAFVDQLLENNPSIVTTQLLAGRYIICYTDTKTFNSLINQFGSSFISYISLVLGLLDRANLAAAGVTQVHQQPYLDLRGKGVLLGFVDTGIDYTQRAFRYEDGSSKIQFLYDQTVAGPPPEGFYLGTEYTNEQINEALRSEDPYQIVPQKDESGHGTFLASVAAGNDTGNFLGAAPDAELIVVKLRKARPFYLNWFTVPPEQENAYESTSVMVGVEYIVKKARQLNRPVVICIGLGTTFGAHDGFSIFEEYLSNIANLKGVCICTAAGNESQARHHTQGVIAEKGATHNIDLKVGENAGNIAIGIWNTISDKISLSVRSPTGELVGRVPSKPGATSRSNLILEKSAVQVEYYFPYESTGSQLSVVNIYNATPGIWTITLYGDIILNGTFHAWLPLTGFVSPTVEFLSATPYYTVTCPSTMFGSINCGAYDNTTGSLFSDSSWGPTRLERMAPDLVAPGVQVGGIYPSGPGNMSGTSVASAITAGACALMMQWGVVEKNDVALSTYQIRAYLIRGCNRSPTMIYPNTQWGYGTLNLIQTFNLMREL